jgi:hypothetical protein
VIEDLLSGITASKVADTRAAAITDRWFVDPGAYA